MAEPDRRPESYRAAVDSTLPIVKQSAVTVITDSHLYTDDVHLYAIELAKATGRPLVLEAMKAPDYHTITQFEGGHISRPQFLAIMNAGGEEGAAIGAYIGSDRAKAYHEKLADAIQSGVKILPGGSEQGMTKDVASMERIGLLETHILNDHLRFSEDNKDALKNDPKRFLKEYDKEIARNIDSMTRTQREAYYNVSNKLAGGAIKTDIDAHAAIDDMFWASHSAFTEHNELQHKLDKVDKDHRVRIRGRLEGDRIVGTQLADMVLENGGEAIVVYGTFHTAHEKIDGYDLDSVLRERGLSTRVIDPTVPASEIVSPKARQDVRETAMSDYARIHRMAAEEGGENRFSVDLRTGEVSTYAPMEKASALKHDENKAGGGIVAKSPDTYFSTATECPIETTYGLCSNFSVAASGQGLRVPEQQRVPRPASQTDYSFG